jgi:hypothetical protein
MLIVITVSVFTLNVLAPKGQQFSSFEKVLLKAQYFEVFMS